ncbi:hypothetical protein [Sphingomonas zeae]|jgi:hypothetical protein|nr:hypothetical protein [Sphingomonas zeae]
MLTPFLLVAMVLAEVSGLPQPARQQALMNEIEGIVVLPQGARPLASYGRNYALSGPDKVVATYLLPSPSIDFSQGCEEMLADFSSRPCAKGEIKAQVRLDARRKAAETPAGKRRWHQSAKALPRINDGGCMQVNVEYEISTRRVMTVSCNGQA